MNKKRLIAVMLAGTMLLSYTSGLASYTEPVIVSDVYSTDAELMETEGEWSYTVKDDGTAEITGYSGEDTQITIPSEIGGIAVTSVGNEAFLGNENIITATISDGITSIEYRAFGECSSLLKVTLPESVANIGIGAFENCGLLISVNLPEHLTQIADNTFLGCNSLMSAEIPDGVASIGSYAFNGCAALKKITIPESVTAIGIGAFGMCTELTSVSLPDSITDIGSAAFGSCTALTQINIPAELKSIESETFSYCTNLTSIAIPSSVKSIGSLAFCGCNSLNDISIPDNVTKIGEMAFSDCSAIERITIPSGVKIINSGTFNYCHSLKEVIILGDVLNIGQNAFYCCSQLESINIPDSIISIGAYAFQGCGGLKSVNIACDSINVGSDAFADCQELIFYADSKADLDSAMYKYAVSNGFTVNVACSAEVVNDNNDIKIKLSSIEGAKIHYTTDGTEPTSNSAEYTEPIAINGETKIKYAASYDGFVCSVMTLYVKKMTAPTISVTGSDENGRRIAITSQENGKIYYSINSDTVDETSNLYTEPFYIDAGADVTVKAFVIAGNSTGDTVYLNSDAVEKIYTAVKGITLPGQITMDRTYQVFISADDIDDIDGMRDGSLNTTSSIYDVGLGYSMPGNINFRFGQTMKFDITINSKAKEIALNKADLSGISLQLTQNSNQFGYGAIGPALCFGGYDDTANTAKVYWKTAHVDDMSEQGFVVNIGEKYTFVIDFVAANEETAENTMTMSMYDSSGKLIAKAEKLNTRNFYNRSTSIGNMNIYLDADTEPASITLSDIMVSTEGTKYIDADEMLLTAKDVKLSENGASVSDVILKESENPVIYVRPIGENIYVEGVLKFLGDPVAGGSVQLSADSNLLDGIKIDGNNLVISSDVSTEKITELELTATPIVNGCVCISDTYTIPMKIKRIYATDEEYVKMYADCAEIVNISGNSVKPDENGIYNICNSLLLDDGDSYVIAEWSCYERNESGEWIESDIINTKTGNIALTDSAEHTAKLTLKVTHKSDNSISQEKEFICIVNNYIAKVEADINSISIDSEIFTDIDLPTVGAYGSTIIWESSDTNSISNTGKVNRQRYDANVKLTATVKNGSAVKAKIFNVVLKSSDTMVEMPSVNVYDKYIASDRAIELSTSTTGAKIYYTLDGSIPSASNGTLYEKPFTLSKSATLKAIGIREYCADSQIFEHQYVIAPRIDPEFSKEIYKAGDKVVYTVSVKGNSGLAGVKMKVFYPTEALLPISVEKGNVFSKGNFKSNFNIPDNGNSHAPIDIVWLNTSNVDTDGELFTITFQALAVAGDYKWSVDIGFDEKDVIDENSKIVGFDTMDGVSEFTLNIPDVNKDGTFNMQDALMLAQALARYNNVQLDDDAKIKADLYRDGKVNNADLLVMIQYLAGYKVNISTLWNIFSELFSVPDEDNKTIITPEVRELEDGRYAVDVKIKNNVGISTFDLSLKYDNMCLKPVSYELNSELGGTFTTNMDSGDTDTLSEITAVWVNDNDIASDGVLYTVIFEKLAAGSCAVRLSNNGVIMNKNLEIIDADVSSLITIGSSEYGSVSIQETSSRPVFENGILSVPVSLSNTTENDVNTAVYAAAYNGDIMKAVSLKNVVVKKEGYTENIQIEGLSEIPEKIKVFVFDGGDGLSPLCKNITLTDLN